MKINVMLVRFAGPTELAGLASPSSCRAFDEHGRQTRHRMVFDTETRLIRITYSPSDDSKASVVEYVPLERCMSMRFMDEAGSAAYQKSEDEYGRLAPGDKPPKVVAPLPPTGSKSAKGSAAS